MNLDKLGHEDLSMSVQDAQDYVEVLREAFNVYQDREAKRHGLWKEYPATDQLRQAQLKCDRGMQMLSKISTLLEGETDGEGVSALADEVKEELYDIINYCVFTARCIDSGRAV